MTKKSVYQSEYWRTPLVIFGTFFYIIGGTLGDGIMSIPVELSKTGFWPFLLIMILPFLTEVVAALVFIQLLQKIRRYLTGESLDGSERNNEQPNDTDSLSDEQELEEEEIPTETETNDEDEEEYDDKEDFEKNEEETNDNLEESERHDIIFDPSRIQPPTTDSPPPIISKEEEEEEGGEIISSDDDIRNSMTDPFLRKRKRSSHDDNKAVEKAIEASQFVPNAFISDGIDLHTISRIYFNRFYCVFVDILMIMKLIPGLYIIGLSQTLVTIFTSEEETVWKLTSILSPIFCLVGFFIVYITGFLIDPVISYASCFKSSMLILVVVLGMFVFQAFQSETNFEYFSRVFFVEVFLMQGSIFFIPSMFSKLRPTKRNVVFFQMAVVGGLVFSQLMSFLWALAVWGVVPQNEDFADENFSDVNLEESLENGELSNMPFTILLREENSNMAWVAYLVEIFVLISFTVSFLITTAVLKTVLDGLIKEIGSFVANRLRKKKVRKKKKKRIRACFSGIQIFSYISMGIINAVIALVFAKNQYFLVELGSWVCVLSYLFFLTALTTVEICCNPFKNVRIWCECPKFLFISLSFLLAFYYFTYGCYFVVYTIIKYSYEAAGDEIPF